MLSFRADGVGGQGHGDFASTKNVEVFRDAFENIQPNTAIDAVGQVLA